MQVEGLFKATIPIPPAVQNELFPLNTMPFMGCGFPMLVDYYVGLSLFPTKTSQEKLACTHAHIPTLTSIVHKQIDGHTKDDSRDSWKQSWMDFINDKMFQPFAKKPQFPRIGVSGMRVTGVDLARSDSGQHNCDDDDSDALDVRICVLLL